MTTKKEPRRGKPGQNQTQKVTAASVHHAQKQAALYYALKLGWPVFPVNTDKRPRTRNGFHDATTDRDQIEEWWRMWPNAGIGVPTGPASRVWVLDLDVKPEADKNGEATLRELYLREHGDLPETPAQRTGGGGRHLFFAYPTDGRVIRNDAERKVGDGIDVRGDGGYVVVPPSEHESGHRYAWEDGSKPSDLDPAQAPEWLLKLVASDAGSTGEKRPPEHWATLAQPQHEGGRNEALASVAGKLFRDLDDVDLAAHLARCYAACCSPPLPPAEVERTINSIALREAERLGGGDE